MPMILQLFFKRPKSFSLSPFTLIRQIYMKEYCYAKYVTSFRIGKLF